MHPCKCQACAIWNVYIVKKIKNGKISRVESKQELPSEREVGQRQCHLSYAIPNPEPFVAHD